jgi:hypothetical protein
VFPFSNDPSQGDETMKRLRLGGSVALMVVATLGVSVAAKPPKPTTIAATATFRCYTLEPLNSNCGSPGLDGVRDDGGPYDTNGVINSGIFDVQVPAGFRVLYLYLQNMIAGSRTCLSIGNCNPDGPLDQWPQPLALTEASIRVKALTYLSASNTYEDFAGGLTAMACGSTKPGLVDFTFWLPSGDGHWGFNFNPKAYPGTTAADLTRAIDGQTWTVETQGNYRGELLSWGHSGITRRNGPSHEGLFTAPFKITITALAATCP